MDAFFASIEQLDNPQLRGRPVVVGYDGPRGVVAAASYEARKFGCHSAQPIAVAKRLCPDLLIVDVRMERYREVSGRMFEILDRFSPVVEPLSVDEAFLDLSGTERLQGPADLAARRIKELIQSELSLTASVGVAPNKFLAKLASDMEKPDGLTVIRAEDVSRVLPPLPVSRLWGIGRVTEARLEAAGIRTIGDLLRTPAQFLERHLGAEAEHYMRLASGIDARAVTSDREAKSIGHEQTFAVNVSDPEVVRKVLMDQVELVAARLRRHGIVARGLSLKIRYGQFETITRSTTLSSDTHVTAEIWQAARAIFDAWTFQPVRLIGVSAERLSAGEGQLGLFTDPGREKQKKLDAVADRINDKFGKRSIRRGGS
ncbi:MAG: DNA polymerase IV [Burkholderiales bacterium]|nr:DNA polymerase IV [Phycisphaerae bacterium]